MKKIIFFVPTMLPHTKKLIDNLRHSKYDVEVFFLHEGRILYPWSTKHSGDAKCVENNKILSLLEIARNARRSDLMIITGWHSWLQVAISIWCFVIRKKQAYWLDVPEKTGPVYKKVIKKAFLYLSDAYLITSKSGFSFFSDFYGVKRSKCFRFPYLSAFDPYADSEECIQIRAKHSFSQEKIRVLIANRFLPRKGYESVYRAIVGLPEEVSQRLSFKILGHGYEGTDIGRKVSSLPNTEMLGWVEFEEYLANLKDCDVYLHASDHEPYGIPPMDAMALGKVVICTNRVYSALDCIKDQENGFIFEPGDYSKLAAVLSDLVLSADKLSAIGNEAATTEEIPNYKDHLLALEYLTR